MIAQATNQKECKRTIWSCGTGGRMATAYADINRYDDPSEEVAHDVDHVIFMVVSHGTYGVLFMGHFVFRRAGNPLSVPWTIMYVSGCRSGGMHLKLLFG